MKVFLAGSWRVSSEEVTCEMSGFSSVAWAAFSTAARVSRFDSAVVSVLYRLSRLYEGSTPNRIRRTS